MMSNNHNSLKKPKTIGALIAAGVILGIAAFLLFAYIVSPAAIRNPKFEHAHFRMQLVIDKETVNFGNDKYQTPYEEGVCADGLTDVPIHFHDNKNQFVHLHWKDMTGGLVLKNYGWDLIGGPNSLLGYRLDGLPKVSSVPIHDDVLPAMPEDSRFWIYSGNAESYEERSREEFINQDFETFFGKESLLGGEEELTLLDRVFPKAMAHEGEDHGNQPAEADLQLINNLLGDVVIFVQKDAPSDEEIRKHFTNLEPLGESTCGG